MWSDPDIVLVFASLAVIYGLSAILAGWVDGVVPWGAVGILALGLVGFAIVHLALRSDGLTARAVPDAFIHVFALMMR